MRSLVAMILAVASTLAACGGSQPPEPEYAEEDGNEAVVTDATPQEVAEGLGHAAMEPPEPVAASTGPVVRIQTSLGTIRIRLDPDRAPVSVANFLQYVRAGFYDGTIFHRVIDDFMIQGGGFTHGMVRKETRAPIALEVSDELRHVDGAVSMARTNDPNSATAQFFICDGPQHRLDGQYAVIGVVIDGLDVVRQIASTPTGSGDAPRADVVMLTVRVE